MPSRDPSSSFEGAERRPSRDPTPPSRETTVKRGRGLSGNAVFGLSRQRSLHSSATRAPLTTDSGPPPLAIGLERVLTRSPSSSNSHSRQPSTATDRSLSRTQSNASTLATSASPSPSRYPAGQDSSFSSNDAFLPRGRPGLSNGYKDGNLAYRIQDKSSTPEKYVFQSQSHGSHSASRNIHRSESTRSHAEPFSPPTSQLQRLDHPQPNPNLDAVGGSALENLFSSFKSVANHMIDVACAPTGVQFGDPNLEALFGKGVNPAFDQLLSAMGHVARKKPTQLINDLVGWKLGHDNQRIPSSIPNAAVQAHGATVSSTRTNHQVPMYSMSENFADRRASSATFILCRALIEILTRTHLNSLASVTAHRLEDLIFDGNLMRGNLDPATLQRSPMQCAKWNINIEVLGLLSQFSFEGINMRFNHELKSYQPYLNLKGNIDSVSEAKACQLLKAMQQLRPTAKHTGWISFCSCMQTIANFFESVHGQPCKNACCRTIEILLLRLSNDLGVNIHDSVGDNKWTKVIHPLNDRISSLVSKPKYWSLAYPAQVALACLSPPDLFLSRWSQMISSLSTRLRERNSRATFLKAVCRLTWCYLRRNYSNDNSARIKSLDDIARNVFFMGRKYSLSKDASIIEPLIQLVRIIGYTYPDQCFKTIIFPLINSDLLSSPREATVENLEPDEMIIGIRSFLAMISDVEKKRSPPFPIKFVDEQDKVTDEPMSPPEAETSRQRTRSRKQSVVRDSRLSQPISTTGFSEAMRDQYNKFCDTLGKITRVCDAAFGGQAVLDEKLSLSSSRGPVSDAWYPSFARREDIIHSGDQRHDFYDLLHVAVQAIPRCLTPQTPIPELLNLLCTGTSHPEDDIATSSAASLKSLACQGHAQDVASRFSTYIMNYDYRYSTMSDGGLLGRQHIEKTLTFYLELLQLWISELNNKSRGNVSGQPNDANSFQPRQLNTSCSLNYVNDVESRGLFFLCSPSYRVRGFAVEVLQLVMGLDAALGEKSDDRIYNTLTSNHPQILESVDHMVTLRDRVIFTKSLNRSSQNNLFIDLCRSSEAEDNSLWHTIFPGLVKVINEYCATAVLVTRGDVCSRLSQMHSDTDDGCDERARSVTTTSVESSVGKMWWRNAPPAIETNVEQWKLYMIFALATMTATGKELQAESNDQSHGRGFSKSSHSSHNPITTATDLYERVIPLLASENRNVRHAAAIGLGSINSSLYESLLRALDSLVIDHEDDFKRQFVVHSRGASSPRGSFSMQPLRFQFETILVYDLASHHLTNPRLELSEWTFNHLSTFTGDLSRHLQQFETRADSLESRRRYCSLLERFYDGIRTTSDPSKWMPFQTRKAHFILLEEWYDAYSPREDQSVKSPHDSNEAGAMKPATTASETERLRSVASSTMAALCAGPLSVSIAGTAAQFNVTRMLAWIENLLKSPYDRTQATGRRALKNLIANNKPYLHLTEHIIEKLFASGKSSMVESYLSVLLDIFKDYEIPAVPHWKMLGALLFTLGHMISSIRMKSVRLLQLLEERKGYPTRLQDFDISVSDKTRTVHKDAQYAVAQILLGQHSSSAFQLFSDYSRHFLELDQDSQRNMVTVLLPWMQSMELHLDPRGGPSGSSYMVLMNLLQMTTNCSGALPTECQALWQALTTGGHAGNARLILDFIVQLCLDRKDQGSVEMVKPIIVFLSGTDAGKGVVDYFMQFIGPGCTMNGLHPPIVRPQDSSAFTHVADVGDVFPHTSEQMSLSIGHLSLILLVDLVVSDVKVAVERLPALLHMVMILWDHHNTLVQDQAREMLIHLVHVFVLAKIDKNAVRVRQPSVEELVDQIRRRDPKVAWSYGDPRDQASNFEFPNSMLYVVDKALSLFSLTVPDVHVAWGKIAILWAMQCRTRHLACRSLQIYRCLMKPLDLRILSGFIEKLAATIAEDPREDLNAYALDIMRTIRAITETEELETSELLPQIFWSVYGALGSIHEKEYQEALSILDILLNKYDLRNAAHVHLLLCYKPSSWQEPVGGLAGYICRGCTSKSTFEQSLRLLNKVLQAPSSDLVGNDARIPSTLLANIPRFMHSFDDAARRPECIETALTLVNAGNAFHRSDWSNLFQNFAQGTLRSKDEFLDRAIALVKSLLLPSMEASVFVFLMSLLLNPLPWIKKEMLRAMHALIPHIDINKPAIAGQRPEIISPLFRLLQTEFCPEVLKVLDVVEPLAVPSDKQDTPRDARQHQELVENLYGIPEQSGWSVPNPSLYRMSSKEKLFGVYNMTSMQDNYFQARPQFRSFRDAAASYFSEWSSSGKSVSVGSMDDIGDLEDFFQNGGDHVRSESMSNGHLRSPPSVPDPTATLPLQSRKREVRKASNAPTHTSNTPKVMSPSSLNPLVKRTPSRPVMPSRSITSPAVNQTTPHNRSLAPPKQNQDPLSDDDITVASSQERSHLYDTVRPIQPKSRGGFGLRNSIKRLAGEKHRRATTKMEVSPQVPRVPIHYLGGDPLSSDL